MGTAEAARHSAFCLFLPLPPDRRVLSFAGTRHLLYTPVGRLAVRDYVFFYGTLMTAYNRPGRQRVDGRLSFVGRGRIRAALFDLGIYPAAVPADDDSHVAGELYELLDGPAVLAVLDEIEGFRSN